MAQSGKTGFESYRFQKVDLRPRISSKHLVK